MGPKGGVVCDVCRGKVAKYDAEQKRLRLGTVAMSLPDGWLTLWPIHGRDALEALLVKLYRCFPEWSWNERVREGSGTHELVKLNLEYGKGMSSSCQTHTARLVPADLAEVLKDLQNEIGCYGRAAETEGFQRGTNILAQLNAGTLTHADFREQTAHYEHRADQEAARRKQGKY